MVVVSIGSKIYPSRWLKNLAEPKIMDSTVSGDSIHRGVWVSKENWSSGCPIWSNTNRPAGQSQKNAKPDLRRRELVLSV